MAIHFFLQFATFEFVDPAGSKQHKSGGQAQSGTFHNYLITVEKPFVATGSPEGWEHFLDRRRKAELTKGRNIGFAAGSLSIWIIFILRLPNQLGWGPTESSYMKRRTNEHTENGMIIVRIPAKPNAISEWKPNGIPG